jgi:hypothetical protein
MYDRMLMLPKASVLDFLRQEHQKRKLPHALPLSDIPQGFGLADILWVRVETTGLRAEKKAALHSSDLHFSLPIRYHHILYSLSIA